MSVGRDSDGPAAPSCATSVVGAPQHFLYLRPDPHGHFSLRPTLDIGGDSVTFDREGPAAHAPRAIEVRRRAARWQYLRRPAQPVRLAACSSAPTIAGTAASRQPAPADAHHGQL